MFLENKETSMGKIHNNKYYTDKEWNNLSEEADEIGVLLTLCDEGSVYDKEKKTWSPSEKLLKLREKYEKTGLLD